MRKKKKLKMEDIAAQANVSRSTVSRVLNGKSVVAEETAALVLKLAGKMDYKFKKSRSKKDNDKIKPILILTDVNKASVLKSFGNTLINILNRQGFMPEVVDFEALTSEKIRSASGVMLINTGSIDKIADMLKQVPCIRVFGSHNELDNEFDFITYDFNLVGQLAARWLTDQGCKNIISIMPKNSVAEIRQKNFNKELNNVNLKCQMIQSKSPAIYEKEAEEIMGKIKGIRPKPDGIFTFNDQTLLRLFPLLIKEGFEIGKSLKLIGCDGEEFLPGLSSKLASIDLNLLQILEKAVETLEWRMTNPDKSPVSILVRPSILQPQKESESKDLNLSISMI